MNSVAEIVRNSRRGARTLDGELSHLFRLSDAELRTSRGTLWETALAHAVIGLRKDGCVCTACRSAAFETMRRAAADADSAREETRQENHDEGENGDTGDKGGRGLS